LDVAVHEDEMYDPLMHPVEQAEGSVEPARQYWFGPHAVTLSGVGQKLPVGHCAHMILAEALQAATMCWPREHVPQAIWVDASGQ
jgi:hypothetical protein